MPEPGEGDQRCRVQTGLLGKPHLDTGGYIGVKTNRNDVHYSIKEGCNYLVRNNRNINTIITPVISP